MRIGILFNYIKNKLSTQPPKVSNCIKAVFTHRKMTKVQKRFHCE